MQRKFDSTMLTELPFGFKGRIYRSPMPFRSGDEQGVLFDSFLKENINTVVILTPRREYIQKTGLDLNAKYQDAGITPIEMPIIDFSVPSLVPLDSTLGKVIDLLQAGSNIVVHCNAGYGRTGTFLACLAVRVFGIDGIKAAEWTRKYIPPALENEDQMAFVIDYGNRYVNNQRKPHHLG